MEGKKSIFIVEDEPDILELIAINLEKSGYSVRKFMTASDLFANLKNSSPDLILLDIMLPDNDGIEVCKTLNKSQDYSSIPIILVTAKSDEIDIVIGLEIGADDYITKPFSVHELVARVKAVLRRGEKSALSEREIVFGDTLKIIPEKFEVFVYEKKINLTTTEFQILKMLAEKPGWVFAREKILSILWNDEKDVFDRTVDVHIKNLRDKLGKAGYLVINIRGVGYKLDPDGKDNG